MTDIDDDDDAAAAIPERTERTDSGALVTESGRHVNRNVVQRGTPGEPRRDWPGPPSPHDDAFDLVTPVRPEPRDVFEEEDATLSHEPDGVPVAVPPGAAIERARPVTPAPRPDAEVTSEPQSGRALRITPSDAGFTVRGPVTDRMARIAPEPDPAPPEPPAAERGPRLTPPRPGFAAIEPQPPAPADPPRERSARITPSDAGFVPPESRRPGTEREPRITPQGIAPIDPRRPDTVRGHVEPRRRPTVPPNDRGAETVERGADDAGAPEASAERVEVVERAAPDRVERTFEAPAGPVARPDRPFDAPRLPLLRAPSPPAESSPYAPPHDPLYDRVHDRAASSPGPARAPDGTAAVQLDRVLRIATILAVAGFGAVGLGLPGSVLRGGTAWLIFLFFVAGGWGALVARLARAGDPEVGLRAALGLAGYVAVAGLLVATGLLTRPVIIGLIGIGFVGFAWREATAPVAIWQIVRDGLRFVRSSPALGALIATLVALACVRMVGAVAALDRNPWDDDLAYTPLVKRVLDLGNLVEPFSFRRLGAYGGHTVLEALGAARGTLANVHLIDRGLGLGLVLLGMLGLARERRTQPLWLALIALIVLIAPDISINTATYWIGVVAFVALYRCVVREHWALVGLVAAMTCTLRQNFLVPVVLFVAGVLVTRLVAAIRTMPAREAWQQERRAWILAGGVALAVIVPWWIAAYASSYTFLFPVFDGTWNHELSLNPAVTTWPQELELLVTVALDTTPIVVIPILAIVMVFVIDRRPGRPLGALAVASALGFVLLAHSLQSADAFHMWRYAFGFATALTIALVLELGAADDDDDPAVVLPPLGRWIVLAALVLQIVVGRGGMPRQAVALLDGVREAAAIDDHGDPGARVEQRRYAAMQAALPPGARVVVMLDDPALLDYRRNAIANLDVPGFASPGRQLPAFLGAEPLRAYLVAEGYRYAAFVRSERSRYFFRRAFWVERMFTDAELFRIQSAYTLDAIDSFTELATTTRTLYDTDGLVVLDLATPSRGSPGAESPGVRAAGTHPLRGDEPARRAAWIRALADREGVHDAWSLTTRDDLRFEDGSGPLRYVDGMDDPKWFEIGRARPAPGNRGTAILPLARRVHLRVRAAGPTDMRLALTAAIALNTVYTHPRLDISLDGELIASAVADPAGRYAIAVTVTRDRLAGGWHDLYLVFSSVADPDKDNRDLRIARLESVEWSPP